ncbi:MAG: DUF6055 domain-containing protein [Actinomycetota bacterium]|nr:DUF6055 domain-containing protein [Actinomycetota bacterium]
MNKKLALAIIAVLIIIVGAGLYLSFFRTENTETTKADALNDQRYSTEPTGLDLIQKALNAGKIDLDTALIYKVKFLFNDPTLPKEYFTENTPFEDSGAFTEIQENWDKLSEETKETLKPYFLRPDNPESYISKIMNGDIKASKTSFFEIVGRAEAYDRPISYKTDTGLNTSDGKIKVWYPEKKETINGREQITKLYYGTSKKIVANLNADQAYAQFVGLLGRVPPSDGNLGADGKTDIYVVPTNYALLNIGGASAGVNVPDNGNGKSSFILLRENLDDRNLKTTTVHELFHSFQRAFECSITRNNLWWIEGTATWSEDFIYPKENTEQGYVANFIPKPESSLNKSGDNFEYGAYVFPFYLSKTYDRGIITKIFEGCAGNGNPLDSADRIIDGGFKKNWKEFTLWNYNRKPILYYKNADQSKTFPNNSSESGANTENNFIAGLGESSYTVKELAPLTSQVLTFSIVDDQGDGEVRRVSFKSLKNFTGKTDKAAIKAIVYPKSGEPYFEDWTDKESRSFCLDKRNEDFEKVVLIFSNADIKNKIGAADIKVKTATSCFEISQGETMKIKPIFAVNPGYVGTLRYQAEGSLNKDSVPANAKYQYLGKWKVNVNYLEQFPPQRLYGISASAVDLAYDHVLEFDLSADSVLKDGTFEIKTAKGDFKTPGWEIRNEISGQSVNVPQNATNWDVAQKGVITEMTENGAKITLPDFVLYNSGGYRDLPHSIVLEIKK